MRLHSHWNKGSLLPWQCLLAPCQVLCCPCYVWHHSQGRESRAVRPLPLLPQNVARGSGRWPGQTDPGCHSHRSGFVLWTCWGPADEMSMLLLGFCMICVRACCPSAWQRKFTVSQETECTKLGLIILQENKFIVSIILPHFELLESASHSYLASLFTLCLGCHSYTVSMASNAPTGSAHNNSVSVLIYYVT